MTPSQARTKALKWKEAGWTMEQIAEGLRKAGYVSSHTGKALSLPGLNYLLTRSAASKKGTKQPAVIVRKADKSAAVVSKADNTQFRVNVAKEILSATKLDAHARIETALAILGN